MFASRAAVVALLACLGAGCCCGPCGPCCGPCWSPPPCGCYQPCPFQPCCSSPCGMGYSTCGPQMGWQSGYAQPIIQPGCSQCMGQASGMTAQAPNLASNASDAAQSPNQLATYTRQNENQLQLVPQANPTSQNTAIFNAIRTIKSDQALQLNDLVALAGRYNSIAMRMNLPPVCLQSCRTQVAGLQGINPGN
jgi:hypothetical protein